MVVETAIIGNLIKIGFGIVFGAGVTYVFVKPNARAKKKAEIWAQKEAELIWDIAEFISTLEDKFDHLTSLWITSQSDQLEEKVKVAIEKIIELINISRKSRLILGDEVSDILEELFKLLNSWIIDAEQFLRLREDKSTFSGEYRTEIHNKVLDKKR